MQNYYITEEPRFGWAFLLKLNYTRRRPGLLAACPVNGAKVKLSPSKFAAAAALRDGNSLGRAR